LSEATYPGVYCLQVTKFDIIDENEDGINEPGEHIHVHNIKVRNVGAMPSPEARSIHLLIQGTQYLDPIIAEPIELPRSIQPGQEVDVPGVLRAFIRNETAEKPVGLCLKTTEYVRIVGYFNERLNRPIPNFCGQTAIFVQYPLVLDPPTYLECVAKGDKVRFKWVLHNYSNKTYGIGGALKRAASTKLSDPNRFFTLAYATAEKPDEANDEIPEIEPHSHLTIDQDFEVNPKTMEYSEGNLSLELMISDPKTGKMRSVQKHVMHMQISGKYQLSQNPNFLLVVNSKTPNHAIHQIIYLIRHRLHTTLDIFNLSLTGSYESPVTGQNVLNSYEGKSVIVFGNSFPYFGNGERNPWDLLDAWQTGLLEKAGTSILFTGVVNLAALNQWIGKMTFPAHDLTPAAHSINSSNAKDLISELKKTDSKVLTSQMAVHRFPVKKSIFKNLPKTADSQAKSIVKKLDKNMPLRRFVAFQDAGATDSTGNNGGVVVCEGVPKNSNMIASPDQFPASPAGPHIIADYQLFLIISAIPFTTRVTMFWNMVSHAAGGSVPCDIIYSGLDRFYNSVSGQADALDKKVSLYLIQYNVSITSR